jgi:hypothetical protein
MSDESPYRSTLAIDRPIIPVTMLIEVARKRTTQHSSFITHHFRS